MICIRLFFMSYNPKFAKKKRNNSLNSTTEPEESDEADVPMAYAHRRLQNHCVSIRRVLKSKFAIVIIFLFSLFDWCREIDLTIFMQKHKGFLHHHILFCYIIDEAISSARLLLIFDHSNGVTYTYNGTDQTSHAHAAFRLRFIASSLSIAIPAMYVIRIN